MSTDSSTWTDPDGVPVVRLQRWSGQWPEDDPDANFRAEVGDYTRLDPLSTVNTLAARLGIPVGALVRYVMTRWATAGSSGLLEIGPAMVRRLWEPVAAAEEADSDEQRLKAYHQLRQMLSWLKVPLDYPVVYPVAGE
jgi:hypothetical protein